MTAYLKLAGAAMATALMVGAAHAETRSYDFSGFTRLAASKGVDVKATVGDDYAVRAEGSAENLERLTISLHGDTLKIGRENKFVNSRWKDGKAPIVYVSMPSLEEVSVSTGAALSAEGVSADAISASVSTGADVELEGTCDSFNASVSTGADLDADDLVCSKVEISISTGADASVHATDSLNASASTGGSVKVEGSPNATNVSKSLGGDVDFE